MSIDLIPDLKKYPIIPSAYRRDKLVVFVGAGVSSLWGCKGWKELAATLVDECQINYVDKCNLLSKYGNHPRKLITIVKGILRDNYITSMTKLLTPTEEKRGIFPDLFSNLASLNAIFVTTNVDSILTDEFKKYGKAIFTSFEDIPDGGIKPKTLFHLHGSVSTPTTLVMTVDEYIKRYQDDNVKTFLKHIFINDDYRILFIGYGVDELEIIDYMIEKYQAEKDRLYDKFYILLPFFAAEEQHLKYEESYFSQLNITVIPYSIDNKGYAQLYDVITTWKSELTDESKSEFYKYLQLIDKNL